MTVMGLFGFIADKFKEGEFENGLEIGREHAEKHGHEYSCDEWLKQLRQDLRDMGVDPGNTSYFNDGYRQGYEEVRRNILDAQSSAKRIRNVRKKKQLDDTRQRYALSCRKCDGYALPVSGTKSHYACDCGHRFAGPKHPC